MLGRSKPRPGSALAACTTRTELTGPRRTGRLRCGARELRQLRVGLPRSTQRAQGLGLGGPSLFGEDACGELPLVLVERSQRFACAATSQLARGPSQDRDLLRQTIRAPHARSRAT